jgi:hypothetical protein
LKFPEAKKVREENIYLREASDSAHFYRMTKVTIQLLHAKEKTWQIYRHKFVIISKHSQLMHNELRYQTKIQAISDLPRKIKTCYVETTS